MELINQTEVVRNQRMYIKKGDFEMQAAICRQEVAE